MVEWFKYFAVWMCRFYTKCSYLTNRFKNKKGAMGHKVFSTATVLQAYKS